jgi:hypothetical protein
MLAIEEKTVFKTTREDAERLAFYVNVANPSILTDLSPLEARTQVETIKPSAPPTAKRLQANARRSKACFTRRRDHVEKAIAAYFVA